MSIHVINLLSKPIIKDFLEKKPATSIFIDLCSFEFKRKFDREDMRIISYRYCKKHDYSIEIEAFEKTFREISGSRLNLIDFISLDSLLGDKEPVFIQTIKEMDKTDVSSEVSETCKELKDFVFIGDFFREKIPEFFPLMREKGAELLRDFINSNDAREKFHIEVSSLNFQTSYYSFEYMLEILEKTVSILDDFEIALKTYAHVLKEYARNGEDALEVCRSILKNVFNNAPSKKKSLARKLFFDAENEACKSALAVVFLCLQKNKYIEDYIFDSLCVKKKISITEFHKVFCKLSFVCPEKNFPAKLIERILSELEKSTDLKELCQITDFRTEDLAALERLFNKIVPLITNNEEYILVFETYWKHIQAHPLVFEHISDTLIKLRKKLILSNSVTGVSP